MNTIRKIGIVALLLGAGLTSWHFLKSGGGAVEGAGGSACCEEKPAAGRYATRGVVRAAGESDAILFIEHENIPGVMPSMTMPFVLGEDGARGKFVPGDAVAFEFVMDERGAVAHALRRIEVGEVDLPNKPESAGVNVPRLKVGDTWPPFSLVDEQGKPLERGQFEGSHVIVTFIFVRCPVPNYCPLLTQKFSALQESILAEPGLASSTRLLSISFDPFDTPPVLSEYARAQGARPGFWRFATGDEKKIDELTRRFAVRVEKDGVTIDHGLCTALISPEGKVLEIWRGNEWKPAEVIDRLKASQT